MFPRILLEIEGYDSFLVSHNNPQATEILFTAIGIVLLIVLVVSFLRNGIGPTGLHRHKGGSSPGRLKSSVMRKISSSCGLDKDQRKYLEFVFKNDGVTNPERVMENPALLDRHFKKAYQDLSEVDDAQEQLGELFSTRNAIDAAPDPQGANRLTANAQAVLTIEKENFPVRIISKRGYQILLESPRNDMGTPVSISRGTRVRLSIFSNSGRGVAYDGKVMSNEHTAQGPVMVVYYSGQTHPLKRRRFRRRQVNCGCAFYYVSVDDRKGKKNASKLMVDRRRFTGKITDISLGGCSIKTPLRIEPGTYLKVEIDCADGTVAVLGKVLRTNRSGALGTIAHLKFLKVPLRAYNAINALVYGYADED